MKKVVANLELRNIMQKAVNEICEAVGETLGPSGNNVLINMDDVSPYITNDGVTIASSFASDDEVYDTIITLVKEASLKTNELVGDGTTSTLVFLKAIFNEGLKKVAAGVNPIVLKNELDHSVKKALNILKKEAFIPSKKELIAVASTSANDLEIGRILGEAYFKMQHKYAIKIAESPSNKTFVEYKKGYLLEDDNILQTYFYKQNEINLPETYVVLLEGYLDSLAPIQDVLNSFIKENKNVLIFASEVSESVKQEFISLYLDYQKNIFLVPLPDYAAIRYALIQDLVSITGCNSKNITNEVLDFKDVGWIKSFTMLPNEILMVINNDVTAYVEKLKKQINFNQNEFECEFLTKRIASLESGLMTVYVGAQTKTEALERKMRFEDALNALEVAAKGIIKGGGVALLKVADTLAPQTAGDDIIIVALREPFKMLAKNCGVESLPLENELQNEHYLKVYNFKTAKFESKEETTIFDPYLVAKTALKNACSIASMLLTTNYLIINEKIKAEKEYL